MKYVPINNLNPEMILGQDIHNAVGARLLQKNMTLSQKDIDFMRDLGIPGVYIDDTFSKDIILKEQIRPELSLTAKKMITGLFGMAYEEQLSSKEQEIKDLVSAIVDDIISNDQVMRNLVDIKTYDDYTYDHSVEVAILSGVIAAKNNMTRPVIEQCVTAGFLHDLGKVAIDEKVINAPRRLTEEERILMMEHPKIAYDILTTKFNFDEEINLAVFQHHEWYNGGGYPNHATYNDIIKIARVLKCADVYDAMTTKRPYHAPYLPSEVMEYIMGRSGMEFDPAIVHIMTSDLCVYPAGCEVLLSDGRQAIVKENHKGFVLRPTVKIIPTGEVLDLLSDSQTRKITILRAIL